MAHTFTVTVAYGAEEILTRELRQMGLQRAHTEKGSVRFMGPLRDGMRACLWSRTGGRVLLRLARFEAFTADALYDGIAAIPWRDHLASDGTLWVDFSGTSKHIRNTRFGAMRTKDAIVDVLRTPHGSRPSVTRDEPDIRVNVHLRHGVVTVALDLSGRALHLRTPNRHTTTAPLKETMAATLLLHAQWPKLAAAGAPLIDPMCGSGTLVTEAAAIAADRAPGLLRRQWGFERWPNHQPDAWTELLKEAEDRYQTARPTSRIVGSDIDPEAIATARHNSKILGLRNLNFRNMPLAALTPPQETEGLVITNPPYGERLGEDLHEVDALYHQIGMKLRKFEGWTGAILVPTGPLARAIPLRVRQRIVLFNGPIECRLLLCDIFKKP